MRVLTLALALTLLAGCAYKEPIVAMAAKFNDTALSDAEFMICRGASVGAVRRAYGTPERAELWSDLCTEEQGFTPSQ